MPQKTLLGTSLGVQWLRLYASNAGVIVFDLWSGTMPCGMAKKKKKVKHFWLSEHANTSYMPAKPKTLILLALYYIDTTCFLT